MQKAKITISGLEAHNGDAVAKLVQTACGLPGSIYLEKGTCKVNAKSIMGVLAFNPQDGMEIEIETSGEDEEAALQTMKDFLVCE